MCMCVFGCVRGRWEQEQREWNASPFGVPWERQKDAVRQRSRFAEHLGSEWCVRVCLPACLLASLLPYAHPPPFPCSQPSPSVLPRITSRISHPRSRFLFTRSLSRSPSRSLTVFQRLTVCARLAGLSGCAAGKVTRAACFYLKQREASGHCCRLAWIQ